MGRDLAQRAAEQREQNGNGQTTEVEPRPKSLIDQIVEMRSHFQMAMPRGAEATQLVRDALTCLRTTRDLAKCEADSVLGGLMTCAQLGLRPGVAALGHAWLIPFWDKNAGPKNDRGYPMGAHRAQIIIGYQGYADLAYRTGMVKTIASRIRYSNDYFEIEYSEERDRLIHRPAIDGPRGEPLTYYAVARFDGGGYALTEPVSQADMEAHRDRYAMAKNKKNEIVGPWRDQFPEMGRKTMVRRLAKLLPKSTQFAQALAADEGFRVDVTPDADPAEVTTRPVAELEAGSTEAAAEADLGNPVSYSPDEITEGS